MEAAVTTVIPTGLTRELELLKHRLATIEPSAVPAMQAAALAQEISAIRLHLKRLAWERQSAPPGP